MCGIAGLLDANGVVDVELMSTFTRRMKHRGPDDSGVYCNDSRSVGFAHTRLSILDVSPLGHQPMVSQDGRFAIVFNGEIYNFRQLKAELVQRGCRFNSDCDTEVLLHLYAQNASCGERMLERLEGMFAFAIWDELQKTCFLARDPFGIKPLYIWQVGDRLAFSSELRTVLAAQLGPPKIDEWALAQHLLFGSTPEPFTLVQDVSILPAGHWMKWQEGKTVTQSYWKPSFSPREMPHQEAIELTRSGLDESINRHFVSDVPVGIFLSGGMDSTALVALARANGYQDIKTFAISFDEHEFNEGDAASRTAKHFGSEHHDWRLKAADGKALVEEFLSCTDRPSNDGFNTFCVSKFARSHGLKVVLSGLGGDEIFGGYGSFRTIPKLLNWRSVLGYFPARRMLGTAMGGLGDFRAKRLSVLIGADKGPLAAYWTMRGFFTPTEAIELCGEITGRKPAIDATQLLGESIPAQPSQTDLVSYLELTRYMRQQLLRDSDIYSMAHSLELRVPLVDRKLFETIRTIPASIRLAAGKRLLAEAVPEIPEWVTNAPKRGFRFPFEQWIGDQWQDQFSALQRSTKVPLKSWYRSWTLLTLKRFLHDNQIALSS